MFIFLIYIFVSSNTIKKYFLNKKTLLNNLIMSKVFTNFKFSNTYKKPTIKK